MKYCRECGYEISDESLAFCPLCGASLVFEDNAKPASSQNTGSAKADTAVKQRAEAHVAGSAVNMGYPAQAPVQQNSLYQQQQQVSSRSKITALLLCLFLGLIGVHRFYVGKTGTGILWLLTLGCCGIGTLVDFFVILSGGFTDKDGLRLVN